MASKIQIRRDTASNWTSADPTLSNGELGLETDTLKLKAGNGSTAWSSLAYYTLGTVGYITATSTDTLTNKTLTAPKIVDAGFIADANGAEQIIFQTTASAVNQFDVTNAATGNPPKLSATGDDSNIDFDLEAKGTGHVTIRGNSNAGAIQFNCESNSHGVILKGPPHSASATYSLELPDADAAGYLKSNGSGKLSIGSAAPAPTIQNTGKTATSGEFLVVTSGGITITLPASPSAGDFLVVKDGTGAAATTSFTVARNGSNIASAASDLTFDKNFAEITMTYIDGTIGWSV